MGKHDRYCIGSCSNDKRYPDLVVRRGHVAVLKWHRFTAVPTKRLQWIKLVSHGRKNFTPGKWTYICSNHFIDGQWRSEVYGRPGARSNLGAPVPFHSFSTKQKINVGMGWLSFWKQDIKILLIRRRGCFWETQDGYDATILTSV